MTKSCHVTQCVERDVRKLLKISDTHSFSTVRTMSLTPMSHQSQFGPTGLKPLQEALTRLAIMKSRGEPVGLLPQGSMYVVSIIILCTQQAGALQMASHMRKARLRVGISQHLAEATGTQNPNLVLSNWNPCPGTPGLDS